MFIEVHIFAWVRPHNDRAAWIAAGHLFDEDDEVSEVVNVPMPFRVPHVSDTCLPQFLGPKRWVHLAAERIVGSLRVVRRSEPSAHQYVRTILIALLFGFVLC